MIRPINKIKYYICDCCGLTIGRADSPTVVPFESPDSTKHHFCNNEYCLPTWVEDQYRQDRADEVAESGYDRHVEHQMFQEMIR